MKIKITVENFETTTNAAALEIERLLTEGKVVSVEVKEWKDTRSLSQNALYWKWLGEMSQQILERTEESHDTDTLHEYFKLKFCPQKEVTLGKATIAIRSTKRLDKGEMNHYMAQIEQWAVNARFKLTVPIESEYRELIDRQNN